jgi:SIR2-like domain
MAAPASLPSALSLLKTILGDPRLPLTATERTTLLAATSAEWPEGLGAYHFLRFEQVVESLGQTVDPSLSSIRALIPDSRPNEYHYAIAKLLARGNTVLTTNFDDLIERAGAELGFEFRAIVTEEDYLAYSKNPHDFPFPLFKLHGSFGKPSSASVRASVATEAGIIGAGTGIGPIKWFVVAQILQKNDLLVLGYSGYDDFDVMPTIGSNGKGRRIYWSRYRPDGPRGLLHGASYDFPATGEFHFDFCFRYLSFGRPGRSARDTRDVVVAIEDSLMTIRELAGDSLPETFTMDAPDLSRALAPAWGDETKSAMLAARLLMNIGYYENASRLLHDLLDVDLGDVALGRCHLWLAQIAADRHRDGESAFHYGRAIIHLSRAPRESLLFVDFVEISGFPVGVDVSESSGNLDLLRVSPGELAGASDISLVAIKFGFQCCRAVKQCVFLGDLAEGRRVVRVFEESQMRPFQSDEVLADIDYWLAMGCLIQADSAPTYSEELTYLNEAGGRADGAARVYERLQRRRKMIDALVLMGTVEASEGRTDWALTTSEEVKAFSTLVGSSFGMAGVYSILKVAEPSSDVTLKYEEWMARDAEDEKTGCFTKT